MYALKGLPRNANHLVVDGYDKVDTVVPIRRRLKLVVEIPARINK